MSAIFKSSHAHRKVVHTYGKRGSRNRNEHRSTSLVSQQTDEEEEEQEQVDNELDTVVVEKVISVQESHAPVKRRTSTRSPSKVVPEVVVYSPQVNNTVLTATSANDKDTKGKGKRLTLEKTADEPGLLTDSSSSSSDAVLVTSIKSSKRPRSRSPTTLPKKLKSASPPAKRHLKAEGSIESLFDDLLSNGHNVFAPPEASTSSRPAPQRSHSSMLAQMSSRLEDSSKPLSGLTHDQNVTRTPVKLARSSAWGEGDSPGGSSHPGSVSKSPSPSRTLQRAQSASNTLQDALGVPHNILGDAHPAPSRALSLARSVGSSPYAGRTYGSNSRFSSPHVSTSDLNQPFAASQQSSTFEDDDLPQRQRLGKTDSYADLRRKLGVDADLGESSDAEGGDADESGIDIHSINQLRSAGENRRFTDEMHYLLDGFRESQPVGVQRASATEVARKMEEAEFVRKLKVYGFVEEVYTRFRAIKAGEGDIILDICLLLFLHSLSSDRRAAETLLKSGSNQNSNTSSSLLDIMRVILSQEWACLDIATAKRSAGKAEKRMLGSLKAIAVSFIQAEDDSASDVLEISAADLLLHILADFARMTESAYIVFSEAGLVEPILDGIGKYLSDFNAKTATAIQVRQLEAYLKIIDSFISGGEDNDMVNIGHDALEKQAEALGPSFARFVATCVSEICAPGSLATPSTCNVLALTLKILVTLTNASKTWSASVALNDSPLLYALVRCIQWTHSSGNLAHNDHNITSDRSPTSANESHESKGLPQNKVAALQLDLLLLSLSLVENVLENCVAARTRFRTLAISEQCMGTCDLNCHCPTQEPAVNIIGRLLAPQRAEIVEGENQILSGYASLVIIYGTLGDRQSQHNAFENLQDNQNSLDTLRNAILELLKLHAGADKIGLDTSLTSKEGLQDALEEIEQVSKAVNRGNTSFM